MSSVYLTKVQFTDDRYHEFPIIIHKSNWHFARFFKMEQLQKFLKTTGLSIEKIEEKKTERNGLLETFSVSHNIKDDYGFWDKKEIPEGATKIKGLSNGNIVDCYFIKDNETLHIYRPNPNSETVYNPLPLSKHISFKKENGYF